MESERSSLLEYYRLRSDGLAAARRQAHRSPITPTGRGTGEGHAGLMSSTLGRKATAEAVGTGLLVAIVVGRGSGPAPLPGDAGLQLLENSTATAGGLVALILAFGSVSGAHFNPVVTLADRFFGGLDHAARATSPPRSSALCRRHRRQPHVRPRRRSHSPTQAVQ